MKGIPILDALSDAIVVVGSKGVIQYSNNALFEVLGYTPEELRGQPLHLLIPKNTHERHEKHIKTYFDTPSQRKMGQGKPLFGRHKNGQLVPVDVSLSHTELDGEPVSVAIVNDITERKQLIEELSASKAMYKALVDNIQEAIYRVNLDGRIEYLNRSLLDDDIESYIGASIYDLATSDESKNDFKEALNSVFKYGNSEVVVSEYSLSPTVLYLSTAIYPIYEFGEITGATMVSRDITLQFLQEKEINENQEYIDKINDLALTGLFIVDIEKRKYLYTNSYFKEITGFDKEGVNELDEEEAAKTLFKPEELEALHAFEQKCTEFKRGEVLELEFQYNSPHKSWMWILTRRSGFEFDSNGKALSYIGSYIDVTKLKNSEFELQKHNELYAHVIDSAELGTWEWNLGSDESRVNDRWVSMLGYNKSDLKKGSVSFFNTVAHPDDLKESDLLLKAHLEGKTPLYECELRLKHKKGHWIWVLDKGKMVTFKQDGTPELVIGSLQDITRSKTHAEQISRSKNEIEQLYLKHNQAVKAGNIGLWDWNLENNTISFSPEWKNQIGYKDSELKEEFGVWESILHPEDKDRILQRINDFLANDEVEYHEEFRMQHKDGSYRWILSSATLERDAANKPLRMLGTHVDISNQKKAKEALKKAYDLLEKTNEVARIGTWEVDLLANEVEWSDTLKSIAAYEDEGSPSLAEALNMYREGEDRDTIHEMVTRAIEHGNDFDVELRATTLKNETIWARTIGICELVDGKCVRLYGLFQDINEKKIAALEIQNKSEALEKTNQLLEQINDVAKVGTWEVDLNTRKRTFSKVACKILGQEEGYAPMNEDGLMLYSKGGSRDLIKEKVLRALEFGESFDVEVQIEPTPNQKKWVRCIGVNDFEEGQHVRLFGLIQDINDKKVASLEIQQKSDELALANQLLEHTHEVARIGSWDIDLKTEKLTWSKVTCEIHEVDPDFTPELHNAINFYKEGESRDKVAGNFSEKIEPGITIDQELQIVTAKGNEKWVRSIGLTEFENGECIRMYGLFQDITLQKQSTEAIKEKSDELEEAQGLLSRSNEVAQIGSWEFNPLDNTGSMSNVASQIFGYSEGAVIQQENSLDIYLEGESRNLMESSVSNAIEHGENYDIEVQISPASGDLKWIRTIGISVFENGKCIRLHGLIQDITQSKRAAIEIQNKSDELQRAQALLDSSNEVAQIGSWEFDIEKQKGSLSKVACQIYGFEEGASASLQDALNTYPEGTSKNTIMHCVDRAINHGENYDVEVQLITSAGGLKWVRAIGVSEFENGECVRLHGLIQDINEQKLARIEIQEKSDQLEKAQTFLNSSNEVARIGTWEVDLASNKLNWSKMTREIHEVDETFAPKVEEAINFYREGESRDTISKVVAQAISEGKSFDEELQIVTITGKAKWVRAIGIADFENGECVRLHGLFQDINERKKDSERIALQENLLQKTFESTAIGMTLLDLDANLIKVNNAFCKYIGYTEEELLGRNYSEFTYIKDAHICDQQISDLLNGEIEKYQIEKRYVHKNGGIIWALIAVSMVRTPEGDPLHFVAQINDISDRKKAQIQFQENYDRLQGILDGSTHVGIIEISADGFVRTFNKGAENLLGYDSAEMLNTPIAGKIIDMDEAMAWRSSMPEEIRDLEGYSSVVAALEAGLFTRSEWTYIRKDGSTFPGLFILTPIYDESGKLKSTVGFITDLTKNKEAASENENLLNVTREQNKRLLNFTHIVSHNLRSHSSNIAMLLDFIRNNAKEVMDNEYMQMLDTASHNLEQTIAHLNEVVAVHTQVQHISEHVNLQSFVKAAISTVQALLVETGGEIVNKVAENVQIHGIPAYLESVILNIITNAIKYRSPDRSAFVEVTGEVSRGFYILHIKDNGLGIDLNRHGKKIFGMYKTFHDNPDSRGVGLFLAKSQIEAMDGKIEVESTPDVGTKFSLYFKI